MFNSFSLHCLILSSLLLGVKSLINAERLTVTKPYDPRQPDLQYSTEPVEKINYITSRQIRHLIRRGIIDATVRDGAENEDAFEDFVPSTFWEKKILTIKLKNETLLRRRAFNNLLQKTGKRVKAKIENDIRTGRRFNNLLDPYDKFELEGDCVGVWSCGSKLLAYTCVRSVCQLMESDYGPTTTTDTPLITATEAPTEEEPTEEPDTTPETTQKEITLRPLTTKRRRLTTKKKVTRQVIEDE